MCVCVCTVATVMCICTSRHVYGVFIPTRTYQWTVYAGATVKLQGVSVILL